MLEINKKSLEKTNKQTKNRDVSGSVFKSGLYGS